MKKTIYAVLVAFSGTLFAAEGTTYYFPVICNYDEVTMTAKPVEKDDGRAYVSKRISVKNLSMRSLSNDDFESVNLPEVVFENTGPGATNPNSFEETLPNGKKLIAFPVSETASGSVELKNIYYVTSYYGLRMVYSCDIPY